MTSPFIGPKWGSATPGQSGGLVTYSFAQTTGRLFGFDRAISEAVYQALIRDAFAEWSAVANVRFVEVADTSAVNIRLGWDAIDGSYGLVGEAMYSYRGGSFNAVEIRFDTAERWSTSDTATPNGQISFYSTAIHEIGHAIGLAHTGEAGSVMNAYVGPLALSGSDIANVRALYGPAPLASTGTGATDGADTLYGTDGADTMLGLGGNDRISAGRGNDTITGGAGNDFIDGGAGIDTATFSGARASYNVSQAPGGSIVTDRRNGSPDGADTLVSIERLAFADGRLALDIGEEAGDAYRLYQAAFDRTPDKSGLAFWIDRADNGMGLVEMAARFVDSAEFRSLYGSNRGDGEMVTLLYRNVLDRTPDASGYKYWLDRTSDGMSDAELLARFSDSTENHANVHGAIADGIWY